MELDLAHLRQWVGREEVCVERAGQGLIDRFKATLDLLLAGHDSDFVPHLLHLCIAPVSSPSGELGEDGHPSRGDFLPPVPLPRRMWAGGRFDFAAPIRVDGIVTRRSVIRDINVKDGRSGTLCFVTVDHRIESDGELAVIERQDIVYRGLDKVQREPQLDRITSPAPGGTWHETIEPTAALLFRYSALTFNGHRIHYDLPYARDIEGYPGLVVHGPLQATLLVHFAAKLKGCGPTSFEFRSLSPLFGDTPFVLNAREDEGGLRLWTSRIDGPVAMEAKATW